MQKLGRTANLLALVLMLVTRGCLAGESPVPTAANPFPAPLPRTASVTVPIAEFASLPDSDGQPARMILLTDEPNTRRLFVNDSHGPLYTVSYDGRTVLPYLDLRAPRWALDLDGYFRGRYWGEKGFRAFAFHPQFNTPGAPGYGKFYTFSNTSNTASASDFAVDGGDRLHDTVLLEWSAQDPAAALYDGGSPREMMRIEQPGRHHNGGMLAFNPLAQPGDPDYGLLYVSVSDGIYGDPFRVAQRLDSIFGKILRLDPLGANSTNGQYGIPADNPFVGDGHSAALGEIYAYGLRNPQRFAWDPANGNLFVVDIGHNGVEEISLVAAGANLGWSDWEGSFRTIRSDGVSIALGNPRGDPAITYPVVEYDHIDELLENKREEVAITGVVVYRDDALPQLKDLLLFSDFISGEVFYIQADALPDSGGQEAIRRILFNHYGQTKTLLELIRAKNREQKAKRLAYRADLRFGTGPDGMLFLLNKWDGTIRRITNRQVASEAPRLNISGLGSYIEAGTSKGFSITATLPSLQNAKQYAVQVETPPGTGLDAACATSTSSRPLVSSDPTLHYALHECSAADGVVQAQLVEQPEGAVLATTGATVWTGTKPPPAVQTLGVAAELAQGASHQFSVEAVNLNPAREYRVRVVFSDHLSAREDCIRSETELTSAVFSGKKSYTEKFTLYGCAPGSGTITSELRLVGGGGEPPLAASQTVGVTVTAE